jgi:hypothetical protein
LSTSTLRLNEPPPPRGIVAEAIAVPDITSPRWFCGKASQTQTNP